MSLTQDQQVEIANSVAATLTKRGIKNPTGITLLHELRKCAKKFNVLIPNLRSVENWFPEMLSMAMDCNREDVILTFLDEFSARISAIEENQALVTQQNAEMLKYLKRLYRNSKNLPVPQPLKPERPARNIRITIVGMEGGYQQHLIDKLKGFPVKITYKHYRDHFSTYRNADYVVYFAKGGHYFSQTLKMYPGRAFYGTGSLSSVQDIVMNIIEKEKSL